MKDLNVVIITTLIAILVWVGIEAGRVSRGEFINPDLLETTTPIDGKIDADYLIRLEQPANVQ